ncbi:hypothetical protein P3S67_002269 [Capsicum chacoense]
MRIRQLSPPSQQLSPPYNVRSRQISSPFSDRSQQLSPPLNGRIRKLSPPNRGQSRQLLPPHNDRSQQLSPPYNGRIRKLLPPYSDRSRQLLPPYSNRSRQLSPPHNDRGQLLSPPHSDRIRQLSPPLNERSQQLSSPHNSRIRQLSPPRNDRTRQLSPPYNGRSQRPSPPQPQEQHQQHPQFQCPNHNKPSSPSPDPCIAGVLVQAVFSSRSNNEVVERVDRAVMKARRDIIEAGENVSAWKVSQAALVMLNADSWDSLGLKMQRVPSLFQLIVTDGKINALIHCFVAVQRITTLYDLEAAILKNEGMENPDVSEVFRLTSVEVISFLAEYMNGDKRRVDIDEFLNFIAEKKSIGTTEKLGVRIQSLGMHITFIKQARQKKFPVGNIKSSDRPATCPCPSASEEMTRLGLKDEVEVSPHTASGSDKTSKDIAQFNRKRKYDENSLALPKKVPKQDVVQANLTRKNKKEKKSNKMWNQGADVSNDFSHGDDSIKMFVNTWKGGMSDKQCG